MTDKSLSVVAREITNALKKDYIGKTFKSLGPMSLPSLLRDASKEGTYRVLPYMGDKEFTLQAVRAGKKGLIVCMAPLGDIKVKHAEFPIEKTNDYFGNPLGLLMEQMLNQMDERTVSVATGRSESESIEGYGSW